MEDQNQIYLKEEKSKVKIGLKEKFFEDSFARINLEQTSISEIFSMGVSKVGVMKIIVTVLLFSLWIQSASALEIDFSRREKFLKPKAPSVVNPIGLNDSKAYDGTFDPSHVTPNRNEIAMQFSLAQDVVILNTDKGFLPKSLNLKAGTKYRIHVVNVNENEKNVSFVMDSFGQHQGTYYGEISTFEIVPKNEGVYTYLCPETSIEGRMVVVNPSEQKDMPRGLAQDTSVNAYYTIQPDEKNPPNNMTLEKVLNTLTPEEAPSLP